MPLARAYAHAEDIPFARCYEGSYKSSNRTKHTIIGIVVPTQVGKMREELASLNHCAVPFLSRAAVNLSWYDSTHPFSVDAGHSLYSALHVYSLHFNKPCLAMGVYSLHFIKPCLALRVYSLHFIKTWVSIYKFLLYMYVKSPQISILVDGASII